MYTVCTKKRNNRVNFIDSDSSCSHHTNVHALTRSLTQLLSPLKVWEDFLSFAYLNRETLRQKKVDIKNTISNLHKRFFGFFPHVIASPHHMNDVPFFLFQTDNQQSTHYFSSCAINCSIQSSSGAQCACINSSDCQWNNDNLVILKVFFSRTWERYTHIADDCERTRVA